MKTMLLLLAAIFLASCQPDPQEAPSNQIMVSILPQKYFVERIVGSRFEVHVMLSPAQCPETYEPTPQQMIRLQQFRLYLGIGLIPFEKILLQKIASFHRKIEIIDTSRGIEPIRAEHDHSHHAHGGKCHGGEVDPHIWLSPREVKIQLKHMVEALVKLDPEGKETYTRNYLAFLQEIEEMDRRIADGFRSLERKSFMVYHPVWSYFARAYGLKQISVEQMGKELDPTSLKKAIDIARKEGIRVIFVQKQFDTHIAQSVAKEINARIVSLDPLAYDWPRQMDEIVRAFQEAMK